MIREYLRRFRAQTRLHDAGQH